MKAAKKERALEDLISIGPAMLRDFELLCIRSVAQLAKQDPKKMYVRLGQIAKQHQDICVLDTFEAAVAQARNPRLPGEKGQWRGGGGKKKNEEKGKKKKKEKKEKKKKEKERRGVRRRGVWTVG